MLDKPILAEVGTREELLEQIRYLESSNLDLQQDLENAEDQLHTAMMTNDSLQEVLTIKQHHLDEAEATAEVLDEKLEEKLCELEETVAEVSQLEVQVQRLEGLVEDLREERDEALELGGQKAHEGIQLSILELRELFRELDQEDLARSCGIGYEAARIARRETQRRLVDSVKHVWSDITGEAGYVLSPDAKEVLRERIGERALADLELEVLSRWARREGSNEHLFAQKAWNVVRAELGYDALHPEEADALALLQPINHSMERRRR